jgi:uncharacterized protein YgbK (DUF1537 family)
MMTVVADDFTGAAEIAGAAWRSGLKVILRRGAAGSWGPCDVRIIDADYRHLPNKVAEDRVAGIIEIQEEENVYLKIDSVLRGSFGGGVRGALRVTGRSVVLIVPQNPARGRVIVDGQYLIDGTPLDRTDFSRDPDHPAETADVVAMVARRLPEFACFSEDESADLGPGIHVANGSGIPHLDAWAARLERTILPAGGTAFFEAILRRMSGTKWRFPVLPQTSGRRLFVCGSASAATAAFVTKQAAHDRAVFAMPAECRTGASNAGLQCWVEGARRALRRDGIIFLHVPPPVAPAESRAIERNLAIGVQSVLAGVIDCDLFVEGGSTAAAVAAQLGWNSFEVIGEWASGIVQLLPHQDEGRTMTLKPGSYAWPDETFR